MTSSRDMVEVKWEENPTKSHPNLEEPCQQDKEDDSLKPRWEQMAADVQQGEIMNPDDRNCLQN